MNNTEIGDQAPGIAEQIGKLLPGLYMRPKRRLKTAHLLESFDVWKLDPSGIDDAILKAQFPAYQTDYQHHQIKINSRVGAYALSQKSDAPGGRKIIKVAVSRNAERIDKAIDQLDAKMGDDSEVRLLVIRFYSVYAFWLVDRHELFVFSKPKHFKRLRARHFLSESDFLTTMQSEIKDFSARTKPDEFPD